MYQVQYTMLICKPAKLNENVCQYNLLKLDSFIVTIYKSDIL